MMVLLTTQGTAADVAAMLTGPRAPGTGIPLSRLIRWRHPDCPLPMFPTVPAALRAGFAVPGVAILAINCTPIHLNPIPKPYPIGDEEVTRFHEDFQVRPLPTEPGRLGVDFAVAVALAQMAAAAKMHTEGRTEHEAYLIECAAISAGFVTSTISAEIVEQMASAYHTGADTVPWPEEVLWPDTVGPWLQAFGIPADLTA